MILTVYKYVWCPKYDDNVDIECECQRCWFCKNYYNRKVAFADELIDPDDNIDCYYPDFVAHAEYVCDRIEGLLK